MGSELSLAERKDIEEHAIETVGELPRSGDSKCFICGSPVESLDETELGNPAPEEAQHYICTECRAFYTVIIDE